MSLILIHGKPPLREHGSGGSEATRKHSCRRCGADRAAEGLRMFETG
jgi:hypothetical protein